MNKNKWLSGFLVAGWLLFGCRAVMGPQTEQPVPPTVPLATSPIPTPAIQFTPELATQSPTLPVVGTLPPLEENWNDRAVYKQGLVKDQQDVLDRLNGASIYHLEVEIADDYVSLTGKERVRYTNQESEPLQELYFQLFPNMAGGETRLTAVLVNEQDAPFSLEYAGASARVPLEGGLAPGESVVIQLDFQVSLPTDGGGNYGLFGYIDEVLVLDGFYPAIPVFDERGWHAGPVPQNSDTTFQDASFYLVRVTAPRGLVIASSGTQVDFQENQGRQIVTLAAGPARDFYLAGSEQFHKSSQQVGEIQVNSYVLGGLEDRSEVALKVATNALQGFSARLTGYAYTEFDVVSTPMDGALGIEYPGIIGINKEMYAIDQPENRLEATLAHEVGHQWFYNMLGNDQMNHPWLDEALTQYITGTYYLDQYGPQGLEAYRQSWVSRWDRAESKPLPIGMPAAYYQGSEYSAIVYGRGPLFVEALAQKMGQDVFDAFLRDYFSSNLWGIATPDVFKQNAQKACGCELDALFAEWVGP
jgi:hypothetical protein